MGDKTEKAIRASFSHIVTEEMDRQGLSLRRLAEKVGMTPSYLSRILRGIQRPPSEEKIRNIAKVLKIYPPDKLLIEAGRFPDSRPEVMQLYRAAGNLTKKDLGQVMKVVNSLIKKK